MESRDGSGGRGLEADGASARGMVRILDTTLRDGELMPGICFDLPQKLEVATLLEAIGVDVIEVGYPGRVAKDFGEVLQLSRRIREATICALAGDDTDEIEQAAAALQPAQQKRIHTYTNLRAGSSEALLDRIRATVSRCRDACDDVEWSAFDATRSQPDLLCQAVETAIASGATTVNIPDSMGVYTPDQFAALIALLFDRVANLDRATVSVHCHDDLGQAVENSIAALAHGVRQIECAVNGLGARKGNADLAAVVSTIAEQGTYQTQINAALLPAVSDLVLSLTRKRD